MQHTEARTVTSGLGQSMLLVDERRRAVDLAPALTLAMLLERLVGTTVVGDAQRRAMVRRIAATRDDLGIPAHIRTAASFAGRAIAAADGLGDRAPFEALLEHLGTLLAYANMLDVPSALRKALADAGPVPDVRAVAVDDALLRDDEHAFALRRLATRAGFTIDPVVIGPIPPLAIDHAHVAAVTAVLRFAASGDDADARRAILTRRSGVGIDDARALLVASDGRATLLETIDAAKVALGPDARRDAAAFVRGLRAVARAYAAPDATATLVLAAIRAAFPGGDDATVETLARIAADFDRACMLAPSWDAAALIAEFAAELASAQRAPAPPDFAHRTIDGEPAAALVPEPRRPVPLRRAHFSASSLNAYAECARKWYFRYVCAAVEDRGSSASFYGTAFHAALEDFHTRYVRVEETHVAAMDSFLDGCVIAAFDRYRGRFDAPVEFELQRRRARRTAKRYLQWLIERARREPFTVIGNEVATNLDLDGHAFVGFIDRLDRDERSGTVTVIDYKTGTIATSAAAYRADVASFREFQLPFYYWARTAAGDRVTKLALIPLKDALLDVAPIELEITVAERPPAARRFEESPTGTISVAELERARAKMIEYAALLESAVLDRYPATDDPDACRYCAYKDACRERPLAIEERFGR